MPEKSRLIGPDVLKTFAILAVPVVHAAEVIPFKPSAFDQMVSPDLTYLLAALGRFCVPLFIFIFAYFQERSLIRNGHLNRWKRFVRLFIPYLFWSALYFVMFSGYKEAGIVKMISKYWAGYGWSGQYYFLVIYQFIFLFPLISRLITKINLSLWSYFVIGIVFFTFCGYSGWFKIDLVSKLQYRPFVYWLPYAVMGILYARGRQPSFSVPVTFGLLLLILIPLELTYLKPDSDSSMEFPAMFISCVLLINAVMVKKWDLSGSPFLARLIQDLSTHTLGIFCVNTFAVFMLKPLFHGKGFYFQFPGGAIIIPLISGLITTFVCLFIMYLFKKIKLGILVAN